MNWSVAKIGTIYQKPAQAIGLSTPPIGCVLDLPGLPGGGSKIYDRSPYGNNGTIIGATWKRLPNGLWVLYFDGEDDYVESTSPFGDISFRGQAITLIAWVNQDDITSTDRIIHIGATTGTYYTLTFFHQVSKILVLSWTRADGVSTGRVDVRNSDSGAANSQWMNYAATYDGSGTPGTSNAFLYANGTILPTTSGASGTGPVQDNVIRIGKSTSSPFGGLIALPRVYNRALSALEIQNHYQQEKHLFGVV